MDKVLVIVIIVVAIDLLIHHLRRESRGCDGACPNCKIKEQCTQYHE